MALISTNKITATSGSYSASGWLGAIEDSRTTSNTALTITGHINLYITKANSSGSATASNASSTITSNKGTVTKSLSNKSLTSANGERQKNVQIGTFTISIPRGTTAQTVTISVSSSVTVNYTSYSKTATGTVTGSTTVSVPALQSYAVTYNNNNGTGTMQAQTKYYGVALSLSYTAPSLANYSFIGWATSAENASSGSYNSTYVKGYSYTTNAALTLYGTYELSYSKPTINNLTVERCLSDGTPDDEGEYALVKFDWGVFVSNDTRYYGGNTYPYSNNEIGSCTVTVGSETVTPTLSGVSGSETIKVGSGNFSVDSQYATTVEITDTQTATALHTTTATGALPTSSFPIDVNASGTAVALLRPAPDNAAGVFIGDDLDVNGDVTATGDVTNTKSSGEVWHTAERSDTGTRVSLGIGSGGDNRGVYNNTDTKWIIFQDANGVTYIPSESIRLKGHSSNIGTTKNAYLSTATSISSGSANSKSLCQLSLEAGTWIIIYGARFPTNTTGYRCVNMSTTKNDTSAMQVMAPVSGGVTQTRAALVVTPASTVTYYLSAYHTATSSLTMPASGTGYGTFMTAVRLM